jgi:DNA-cytosine methyltransferase
MEKLRTLDLFSGIGGFSLGLDSTGYFETVAFCEIEEFPCKVLNKHWPDVPIYNDVRELSYEKLQADGLISRRRGIDVICGGYPCQPFSVAGRQKGEEDPRHLWPEYFRLIKELRPSYVIGENVGGHIRLGLDSVLEDLDSENYTVRCFSVEAASLGAPHRRERIFWIAVSDAQFKGLEGRSRDNRGGGREVLSGIEHDGHSVRRQVRRTGGKDGGAAADDVSDTQSQRRGGRNRGGRRAEQWELLKTEQEGRALGREAERCSELPGQEGEGETTDVADASSNGRDAKRTDQETRGTLGGSIEGRMLESEGSGSRSEVSGTEHVADAECESEHGVSNGGSDVKPKKKRQKTGSIDGSNCGTDVTDTHSEGLEGTEEARNSEEERTIAEQFTARQGAKRSEEERGETAFESYLGGGNDGISAWLDGSWERGIPRVAPSNKLRVPRLKALGNAVLPQLVYMVGMTIVLSTKRSENEEE